MSITIARRVLFGGATLVVLAGVTSCRDDANTDGRATPKPSLTPSHASPTSGTSPTDSGSGAPPSTGPSSTGPTEPADPTLVADLLGAPHLPGLNVETRWTVAATYPNEGPDFSTSCQPHPWTSIGSTAVVRRDFTGPAGSTASAVVATFATGKNARRAQAVWDAWARDCKATVIARGYEHPRINDEPYTVRTAAEQGRWWLLTYGPVEDDPDASYFEAFGLVRSGDRLALVRMTSAGQDYNYEPGQEPVAKALIRTARLLVS
ncbi:MAG: hypothetical protein ABJA86_12950 [Nocardioidaceae bacterium]